MGQNFRGFCGWPNIHKNFIHELGILTVLSHDSGQHLQKFYPRISFLEPSAKILSRKNFPLYGKMHWYISQLTLSMTLNT